MKISQSVKLAGILVALVVIYFMLRGIFSADQSEIVHTPNKRFAVVAEQIAPQPWRAEVVVRGRTEAERKVLVRAETAGAVAATPTREGSDVKTGDILCQIAPEARKAQLSEAKAALAKARLDFNAAAKLFEQGFRSETGVATARAALDLASANVERAEIELAKTKITAPFDGAFDKRHVETGDFMKVGDPCGTVIQRSPFLVSGAVSEKDVAKISIGDRGRARLSTGEIIDGTVRYVAAAADPATRTFDVELEVPNEDGSLRDGVTAEFTIFTQERQAHLAPRSALTLGKDGEIGVRVVDAQNAVAFSPVTLIGESPSGVWLAGLTGAVNLIVQGQDYVKDGQIVDVVSAADAESMANPEADP